MGTLFKGVRRETKIFVLGLVLAIAAAGIGAGLLHKVGAETGFIIPGAEVTWAIVVLYFTRP